MKSKWIFLSWVFLTCLWSCSKDTTNPDPDPSQSTLVKTVTLDYGIFGTFTSYLYHDNSKRIVRYISADQDSSVYTYSGKQITEQVYDFSGPLVETAYYYLNDQNLIDSSVADNGHEKSKRFYNAEGYLISARNYDFSDNLTSIETYTIENGNTTLLEVESPFGDFLYSETNSEFDGNSKNTVGSSNLGRPFFGTSSKQFSRKKYYKDDSTDIIYEFLPTYDNQGRVVEVEFRVDGIKEYTQIFTYY